MGWAGWGGGLAAGAWEDECLRGLGPTIRQGLRSLGPGPGHRLNTGKALREGAGKEMGQAKLGLKRHLETQMWAGRAGAEGMDECSVLSFIHSTHQHFSS